MTQDTKSKEPGPDKGGGPPPRRPLTAKRKWLFRGAAVSVVPVALLLLVELGLRLGGYGTTSSFFTSIPGRDAYTTNQRYGWRFFPPALARQPVPCELPAKKADGTYRIFVLGGSAAQGVPEEAFAFGRILEVMLAQSYPATRFEVVNAAMTAINSHVVRDIARHCAKYEPDLFVVYMGHNEVVGPYGPGTVFAGFSDSLTAIRGSIWLGGTRLGQLLRNLSVSVRGSSAPTAWRGMQMFERNHVRTDDPRLEATRAHFRQNLLDICNTATATGARIAICTVPANLKGSPPFASLHRPDLTPTARLAWEQAYDKGVGAEQAGQFVEALAAFETAEALDDQFAELRFRLGRCYLGTGNAAQAKAHFLAARDLDALRFRADSRINRIVAEVAAIAPGGVELVDVAAAMATQPVVKAGIVGQEFFHEHVHLNFAGNYVVAAAVFETITSAGMLPASVREQRAGAPPALPSPQFCAERLALSNWARVRQLELILEMTADPPFDGQLDHRVTQQWRLRRMLDAAAPLAKAGTMRKDLDLHAAALQARPDDLELIRLMALLLADTGDHRAATEQWRALLERVPGHGRWQIELGTALTRQGLEAEAFDLFEQGLDVLPDDLSGHVNLGIAKMRLGDLAGAEQHFRRVLEFADDHFSALSNLGVLLLNTQRPQEAVERLRQAQALDPNSDGARFNLGLALMATESYAEAAEAFRHVLKRNPKHPGAREQLDAAQAQLNAAPPSTP